MPMTAWFRRVATLLLGSLLLGGCSFVGPQSVLDPSGPIAIAQYDLFMWSFWLSLVVMAATFGVMAFVLVRFRRRRANPDAIPTQFHGSTGLEIGLTIAPVIIVILIAVPTVRTIFETEQRVTPTEQDLVVKVTGYQWWWKFEYPELGITTANELHIPTDRRVVLQLDSADVLHSFWVPRLAGKRDMIPNQDNQLHFTATEPGEYYGQCAELCLGAHAYMKFRVIATPESEFEAWASSFDIEGLQTVQADPQVQQGYQLFAQKGCTTCHTIDGYRADTHVGTPEFPNLTNFGLRTTVAAAIATNDAENLEAWLRDPQAMKPGNYMPALWQADDPDADEEIAAIAAYLLSLGTPDTTEARAPVGGN